MEIAARSARSCGRPGAAAGRRRSSRPQEVPAFRTPSPLRGEGWGARRESASDPDHRKLSHVRPVGPDLGLHLDPGFELIRAGHDARALFRKLIQLGFGNLEEYHSMN